MLDSLHCVYLCGGELDLNRCSINQLWVPIFDRLPQVEVKKEVHPIRFASDSRIALLAVVVNRPGSGCFPAKAGTILHMMRPCPGVASFLSVVSAALSAAVRMA